MRYRFTFYLMPLFVFTGCVHNSKQELATLSETPSTLTINKKISDANFSSQSTIPEQWWEIFQDPQLNILIYKAIKRSPTLQEAEASILKAQAEVKITRSNLFPQLHANAEENWQYLSKYGLFRDFFPTVPGLTIPSKFNEIDLSLSFSYELDFWGKNQKKLKAALGLAIASEMEKRQSELILCSSVAFTYFTWQAHYAELILQQKNLSCQKQLTTISLSRYSQGVDNVLQSLEQKSQIEELEQKILTLEKEIALDELFLKNLLGEGPDRSLHLQFTPNPSHSNIMLPSDLNFDLISQRPDVMAQIWKVEAARQEIGVAKAEFYPDVSLSAFAGLSSLTFSHLFEWASRTGALRPALHLPLFMGGKLEGNFEEKTSEFNKMVYSYNSLLLQAAQEVASEVYTFLSIQQQITSQKKVLTLQKESLDTYTSRYALGLDDISASLLSQKLLLSQEIYEVQLKQYKILSLVRLLKSLGGGFSSEAPPWTP